MRTGRSPLIRGLRVRFLAIVLGLALFPLLLLPLLLGRSSHAALEEQAVVLQREVAAGVAAHIEATLDGASSDLASLDRVSGIRTVSVSQQRILLSNLLSSERLFQDLAVADIDGRPLARVARDQATPPDIDDLIEPLLVRQAVGTSSTAYGPVWFDDAAREPLMAVTHPLVDPKSGAVDSVLIAHVRFKPIWDALADLDLSDRRDAFVVDEAGEIVAHRDPTVVLRSTVVNVPSSDGPAVGRLGTPVIVATAPVVLGSEKLIAVAEQPESIALEPASRAIRSTALVAIIAVVVSSAAIGFISRRFIRPVELLASSARRVASGQLEEHVHVERADEIGDLALAFNRMVGELRELVGSLERRVQDRTFELEAAASMQQSLIGELESKNREMARVQEQLEELVRSKDEFLGSVSHELRTPLASVVGFAAELRDRYEEFDSDQRRELLGLIADQGQDMSNIINDLLVAARADSDSLVVQLARVDLETEIDAVLRQVPDLTVRKDLPTGSVEAFADAGRIRQILRNLLTNAGRYGGPDVSVSVVERESEVVVCVKDNGPGIPDSEWERIFDPYGRSHHREGQPASVGLGLTVSRILARRMGGDLTYRYDDHLSVFKLVLPSSSGCVEASSEMGVAGSPSRGST